MGKLILISGENNSGKSLYAEKIAAQAGDNRFYIATMIPQTAENRLRIEKHIRQRAGLNFQTLELPYCVGDAPVELQSAVLLEDVSNLLSNVFFERNGTAEQVLQDILTLTARSSTLVAVTISGLDASAYDGETAAYINALNRLNEQLAQRADSVIQMKHGTPVVTKGGICEC